MADTVTIAPVPALPAASLGQRLRDWSKQPNTQRGMGLVLGGVVLAALHPFANAEALGATLIATGLPLLISDNTTDAIKTRDVANAIAHAAAVRTPAAIEAAAEKAAQEVAARVPVATIGT